MDEADWSANAKPILSETLVAEIAQILGLTNPTDRARLSQRLQRYSDRLFFSRKRARFEKPPGEVRKEMHSLLKQISKLQDRADRLAFSKQVTAAYGKVRRKAGSRSPSLDTLRFELDALAAIAHEVAEAPPHKRGQRGRPLLHYRVGAFMALFETLAGERAEHRTSLEGVPGDYLGGKGGIALRTLFEAIAPEIQEGTLARIVGQLSSEFEGRPMREADFDFITAIEDAGAITVVEVQA